MIEENETKRLRNMVDYCYNINDIEKLNKFTSFQRYCIYTHLRDIDIDIKDITKDITIKLDTDLNFDMHVGSEKERTIFAIVER
ncbi:MAG: hypothetical protein Q4G09_02540 [Clostridia bacterium]|nr:hypothetical protein [Clostridia bacterium]